MLSVKQGGIKYNFLSFWYDSTKDWTRISLAMGEHSTHLANEPVSSSYCHYIIIRFIFRLIIFHFDLYWI